MRAMQIPLWVDVLARWEKAEKAETAVRVKPWIVFWSVLMSLALLIHWWYQLEVRHRTWAQPVVVVVPLQRGCSLSGL